MQNLKVGDKVKIHEYSEWYGLGEKSNPTDEVGVIIDHNESSIGHLCYEVKWENGMENSYANHDLVLVEAEKEYKPKRKHQDLILAWLDGAEVEYWSPNMHCWRTVKNPQWHDKYQYRVKPEETKEELLKRELSAKVDKLKKELAELESQINNL